MFRFFNRKADFEDLERIRDEKRATDQTIRTLEHDRDVLNDKIEELTQKRVVLEQRLQQEKERSKRQDRGLRDAEETFTKLVESQKTLTDFVRKEYQDTKRRN